MRQTGILYCFLGLSISWQHFHRNALQGMAMDWCRCWAVFELGGKRRGGYAGITSGRWICEYLPGSRSAAWVSALIPLIPYYFYKMRKYSFYRRKKLCYSSTQNKNTGKQSRSVCVMPAGQGSCRQDEEAAWFQWYTDRIRLRRGYIISFVVENSAKEVIFYEEIYSFVQGFHGRIQACEYGHSHGHVCSYFGSTGVFYLVLGDYLKIGFSTIANQFVYYLFGPVAGGLFGGALIFCNGIIRPTGAFFLVSPSAPWWAVFFTAVFYKRVRSVLAVRGRTDRIHHLQYASRNPVAEHAVWKSILWRFCRCGIQKHYDVAHNPILFYTIGKTRSIRVFRLLKTVGRKLAAL